MGLKTLLKKAKHKAGAFCKKAKIVGQLKKESLDIKLGHYKKADISISDLVLKNSRNGEFLRFDVVVRYLAVEEYYHKNEIGFSLYKKMQNARVGDGYAEKALAAFIDLIESYDKNGYDRSSYIQVDKNFNLIDGSHRLALGLYYRFDTITAYILNSDHPVDYKIDWFFENSFSSKEIAILHAKAEELLKAASKPFSCVIWSPAVPYADQIMDDLKYYGRVTGAKKYSYRSEEYSNIVRAIYAIDDIEKWKIDIKLEHMKTYPPELIAVDLVFDDPEFRVKSKTGLPLSKRGERAKKALRAKYKNYIQNYFFDIVMHIGDNVLQSNYMKAVFKSDLDLREIVDLLNNFKYAFVKTDVPYMPVEFPDKIPVGKDADILCDKDDFDNIVGNISRVIKKYTEYNIVNIPEDHGIRIRVQEGKILFYQFDISYKVKNMDGDFVADALNERVYNEKGFYTLSAKHEYIYRAIALRENSGKTHHKDYLQEHSEDYDEEAFNKYCCFSLSDLIHN